jgi:ammonium transporter, Amt family
MAYSFVVSYIILYLMDFVPFLKLRVTTESELAGLDYSEMGEYAFEGVSLKMAQWDDDILPEVVADEHGGVHSKQ